MQQKTFLSWLAVLASAFCFYLATTIIRLAQSSTTIAPAFFVFSRFLSGFIVITLILGCKKKYPRANRYSYLIGRTISNTIAVYCFYRAVDTTTVATANILNMTYPIFIVLITWFFLKKQRDLPSMMIIPVAFIGIWFIIAPKGLEWNWHNLWGLASGISASIALICLNLGRQYDDSQTTLFYMFAWGTAIIWILFYRQIHLPNPTELYYLALCSFYGISGQYLLTYGFRYITAVEGSIISSTRILLAALLGPILVADPPLTRTGWIGALLIITANIVLAVRKAKQTSVYPKYNKMSKGLKVKASRVKPS